MASEDPATQPEDGAVEAPDVGEEAAELGPPADRPASPGGRTGGSGSEHACSDAEIEEENSSERQTSSSQLASSCRSEQAVVDVEAPRLGKGSVHVASVGSRPINKEVSEYMSEESGLPTAPAEAADSGEDSASQRSSQSGHGEMAAWSRLQDLEREVRPDLYSGVILRDARQQLGRAEISAVRDMLMQKKRSLLMATTKRRPDVPLEVEAEAGQQQQQQENEEVHSTVIDLSFRPNLDTQSGRMSESYLKMLDLDKHQKHDMGDTMRMMLADGIMDMSEPVDIGGICRSQASQPGRQTVGRRARGMLLKRTTAVPAVKLDAIDESENDLESVESVGSHFNVSSDDSGDNVGDLTDFIDGNDVIDLVIKENFEAKKEIDRLREEAAQRKKVAQDLAVETAAKEAHYESKIHRLTQQLEMEQKSHAVTREKLAIKRGAVPSVTDEKQQLELTKLLEAAQVRNATLQEGKRIAEARVEDLKRAVALEQQRHKKEAEELMTKMGSMNVKSGGAASIGEPFELRNRLKSAQEEKNVLINTFEGKEVQWKTQIENTQLEMEGMKRKHEAEIKRLESVIASRDREQYDPSKSPLAETNAISASVAPDPTPDTKWWVCPLRNPVGGAPKPAYCQEFCWKVLSTVSGNLALWCSMRDYTILEASREANVVWGSALLTGKSIFSLASGASSAAWLKKAFHCHQRMAEMEIGPDRSAPTFIVRDLGCEAFISKSGEPFDSSVITACFPAESACNRPAVLLVILEPLRNTSASSNASGKPPKPTSSYSQSKTSSSGRASAQRHLRQRSSQSEVSQSSVSPSDSASNVRGF